MEVVDDDQAEGAVAVLEGAGSTILNRLERSGLFAAVASLRA